MALRSQDAPSPSADIFPLLTSVAFVVLIVLSATSGRAWPIALSLGLAVCLLVPLALRLDAHKDLSFYLLLPTILSASQNVYLLFVVHDLSAGQMQVLIIVNFLYAVILLSALRLLRHRAAEQRRHPQLARIATRVAWMLVLLTGYAVFSVGIFGSDPSSALAAFRNFSTPILFTLIGLQAAQVTDLRRYASYLVVLAVAVVVFGFIEWTTPHFWQQLGIADLWEKKDIPVSPGTGLPGNFYSSELIGGSQQRRMVGSFADPVHLGTFLFAALVAAWYLKRNVAALFMTVGCALAVSKGALLSFCVLVAVAARYRSSRFAFWSLVAMVTVVGYLAYGYTLTSSTGSSTAHVEGLLASFTDLPSNPLGHGIGNVGILATILSGESQSDVSESGIGVIVGQLGLPGIALYGWFFMCLGKAALRIADVRERVLAVSLLGAFFLNAAFNEVALSPNSAAPYFVMIGLVIGSSLMQADGTETCEPSPQDLWQRPEGARDPYRLP